MFRKLIPYLKLFFILFLFLFVAMFHIFYLQFITILGKTTRAKKETKYHKQKSQKPGLSYVMKRG